MGCFCASFTAEAGPGVVPGQLSVDGSQQLRLDLHDAGHRRTFRQHPLPCQDHVGKLRCTPRPFLPCKFGLLSIQSLVFMTTAEYHKTKNTITIAGVVWASAFS